MKIKMPLQSTEARGTIGPFLTFSVRQSGQQVRFQKKQKIVTPSWKQADNQSLYRVIYARWLSFSDAQRKAYDDEAKSKNFQMSGWNLFLQKAFANPLIKLGLVGYWSMNRTGFGTVLDLSKNGNVGTLMPSWPSNSPQYVDSKNTKLLKALSFDGVDDRVEVAHNNSISFNVSQSYTVVWWIKGNGADQTSVYPQSVRKGYNYYALSVGTSVDLSFRIYDGITLRDVTAENVLNGAWHHLAMVVNRESNNLIGYQDGTNTGSADISTVGDTSGTDNLYIGGIGTIAFKGLIDDVRIYNRALSLPEIQALYNQFK